ncbi:glycosyltransferase family 39 protein, partial [candidate division KSB1 bacterium]|nr:glycosyltransferase family 39 protein [candidate division KSB1 bacterium]
MKNYFKDNNYFYLGLILFAALIIRLLILHIRWINPDEGAHLLDARFILDGYIPLVDYDSRQPFYLVMISLFLKLFGVTYKAGRLLPLFSSLGTGVMLFFIGRRMFNVKVGLIACTIFLFLPLSLIWSTVVKTEPLAIFLACTSIFFVIKSTDNSIYRFGWMILAGIFAALAFYARQLSIYLPLTITIYLLFRRDIKFKQIISQLLLYLLGYLSICVAVSSFFLSKLGYQQIIFSQLNPFYIVFFNVFHLLGLLPQDLQVVNSSGIRVLDQELSKTIGQWQDAFFFSFFIVLGALAVGIRTIFGSYRDNAIKENLYKYKYNYLLLSLWLVFILLPYILQSVVRGFYTQYFVELLPPLILLASLYFEVIYKKLNIRFLSFIMYS